MSVYNCSITGEIAETPVASKKTGHIYEKRNIDKFINANQLDPVTNQLLTKDDIIPVKVSHIVKPRPTNTTGVSDLVTIFQNEYDSILLEAHVLRNNLENVRKELSQTLYQHDAACRLIARLIKERDEAQSQLGESFKNGHNAMEEEKAGEGGLSEEVVASIAERKTELNAMRKERRKNKEIANSFASQEMISEYKLTNSITLHSTTKPGITCLDINIERDDLLVTGGNDGGITFYNKAQDKVVGTFTKHHKKITDVKFVPIPSGEENNVFCILSCEDGKGNLLINNLDNGEIDVAYRINNHQQALVGCVVHPVQYVGIFACRDGSFSYHDLTQGRLLSQVNFEQGYQLRNLKVHPDGHIAILGGYDGSLRIWDILGHKQLARLSAHNGPIDSLNFSENGTNFATSSYADKTVKLWDLRNLEEENFKIVDEQSGGSVNFDQFGQFLAVGTNSLRLFNVKNLEEFARLDTHKDIITSIQFGSHSSYMATISLDRHLNIYS